MSRSLVLQQGKKTIAQFGGAVASLIGLYEALSYAVDTLENHDVNAGQRLLGLMISLLVAGVFFINALRYQLALNHSQEVRETAFLANHLNDKKRKELLSQFVPEKPPRLVSCLAHIFTLCSRSAAFATEGFEGYQTISRNSATLALASGSSATLNHGLFSTKVGGIVTRFIRAVPYMLTHPRISFLTFLSYAANVFIAFQIAIPSAAVFAHGFYEAAQALIRQLENQKSWFFKGLRKCLELYSSEFGESLVLLSMAFLLAYKIIGKLSLLTDKWQLTQGDFLRADRQQKFVELVELLTKKGNQSGAETLKGELQGIIKNSLMSAADIELATSEFYKAIAALHAKHFSDNACLKGGIRLIFSVAVYLVYSMPTTGDIQKYFASDRQSGTVDFLAPFGDLLMRYRVPAAVATSSFAILYGEISNDFVSQALRILLRAVNAVPLIGKTMAQAVYDKSPSFISSMIADPQLSNWPTALVRTLLNAGLIYMAYFSSATARQEAASADMAAGDLFVRIGTTCFKFGIVPLVIAVNSPGMENFLAWLEGRINCTKRNQNPTGKTAKQKFVTALAGLFAPSQAKPETTVAVAEPRLTHK
jgi:hypothetical protein